MVWMTETEASPLYAYCCVPLQPLYVIQYEALRPASVITWLLLYYYYYYYHPQIRTEWLDYWNGV